jgi:hypothetical protein
MVGHERGDEGDRMVSEITLKVRVEKIGEVTFARAARQDINYTGKHIVNYER